jgi:Uma2 family endonuclease
MISPMTADAPATDFPRRRFTVDEVNRMAAQGILGEDEPVELLDGELLIVSPQDPRHAAAVAALARRLTDLYRVDAHVRPQLPLNATLDSLPEPDLAVVKGQPLDYQHRHPVGVETLLVVELARTSQAVDRRKARIYATAGVPVYWLIDLTEHRIEIFSQPSAVGTFTQQHMLSRGEEIELPGLDHPLQVSEIAG